MESIRHTTRIPWVNLHAPLRLPTYSERRNSSVEYLIICTFLLAFINFITETGERRLREESSHIMPSSNTIQFLGGVDMIPQARGYLVPSRVNAPRSIIIPGEPTGLLRRVDVQGSRDKTQGPQ